MLHQCKALACKSLPPAAKISVLTNLYDNSRLGNNPYETVLTPAVVASSAFGLLGSYVVEGAVFSQVLIMANVAFQNPNGTRQVRTQDVPSLPARHVPCAPTHADW